MFVKSCEVLGERCYLMIGGRIFGGRNDFASDQFGPAFQFAENRPSGIFIAASGRNLTDDPLSVTKLGRERRRFGLNPQRAILAGC